MMAMELTGVIPEEKLTDADREILDVLQSGARTKGAIVDETGLHRNTVGVRLPVLEAGEAIRCIHESTALYELADDPRYPDRHTVDLDELREALDEAREAYEDVDGDGVEEALSRMSAILHANE